MKRSSFDILVAGSGFAGSVTAMGLAQLGFRVLMVEKGEHPRFAIGESSTPIADMILRSLARKYDLPFLETLSRYGSWREHHPDLNVGVKRGFAYYFHTRNREWQSDPQRFNPLLVAASSRRKDSDTHWYRADLDAYLVKKARETGVRVLEKSEIRNFRRTTGKDSRTGIEVALNTGNEIKTVTADWLVDATGSSQLARTAGVAVPAGEFRTKTGALYTHLDGIPRWDEIMDPPSPAPEESPFPPDHSALHHMIEPGWIWNLRFRDGRLSVGLVIDRQHTSKEWIRFPSDSGEAATLWHKVCRQYPSLERLFHSAEPAADPGRFFLAESIQRRLNRCWTPGWIALPNTAGFIDPLHSTGIAHSLAGVERLLEGFGQVGDPSRVRREPSRLHPVLDHYQQMVQAEIDWIDRLVSLSYRCRLDPELFHAATMIYFAATVSYEQRRLRGRRPESYLLATDKELKRTVESLSRQLKPYQGPGDDTDQRPNWIHKVRDAISPWNRAGLLNLSGRGLYRHTAVSLTE